MVRTAPLDPGPRPQAGERTGDGDRVEPLALALERRATRRARDDDGLSGRPTAKRPPRNVGSGDETAPARHPHSSTPSEADPAGRVASGGAARLYVDGGSRGNPGKSAIGVVLQDERGQLLEELGRTIGIATNNVAEYRALLAGLELARDHGIEQLEVFSDSELLVKQIQGKYRVKNEGLQPLHEEAKTRLRDFRRFTITHVPREKNAHADSLVNQALDEAAAHAGLITLAPGATGPGSNHDLHVSAQEIQPHSGALPSPTKLAEGVLKEETAGRRCIVLGGSL